MERIFDWSRMFMNELPTEFLLEVGFRVVIMFVLLLVFLRFAGKRGVKQLSVFEIIIIVALGSAVGDPMLYEDVGMLPGIVVMAVVITLYRLITMLTAKSKRIENFLEGQPKCLIEDGEFVLNGLKNEHISADEFFSELRMKSVEHLGQVKRAYLETSGDVSVIFREDQAVNFGLPILPELFNDSNRVLDKKAHYACSFCGHVQFIQANTCKCDRCGKDEWVEAIDRLRIS
ncbi:MAG: YetF domain-containing protein [Aquaticitalea sp.]